MAGTFTLQIVTPEREVFNSAVASVRLPGMNGEFGVLRNHAPLIAALQPGEVEIRDDASNEHVFAIGGGFFQVSENQAMLLADSAIEPGAIDLAREAEIEREARRTTFRTNGAGLRERTRGRRKSTQRRTGAAARGDAARAVFDVRKQHSVV